MLLFNYLAFQLCWFALLFYDNYAVSLVILFFIMHFIFIHKLDGWQNVKLELLTIFIISTIGLTVDLLLTSYKIYIFPNNMGLAMMPLWYSCLWLLFSSTLNHCFYLFYKLPSLLIAVIGCGSLPFMYFGASKSTSNFTLGEPISLALLVVGLVWFLLLPACIKITLVLRKYFTIDIEKVEY